MRPQNVTVELLRRGYGEDDITKFWGHNLPWAMKAMETTAAAAEEQ